MSEAFGIMDPAYFVNKNEILKWVNNILKLSIEKIDSLGNGAAYCQVLDIMYPGSIMMSKVNWKAKQEYECLNNFKFVTTCLEKHDVKKNVDVNKLVKCKYQDNLEFAQWFKRFYDMKCGDRGTLDYDPEARRAVKANSTVDIPKVARKEAQAVQKSETASKVTSHATTVPIKQHSATTTVTAKKPPTPTPSINAKRPLSQLHSSTVTTKTSTPLNSKSAISSRIQATSNSKPTTATIAPKKEEYSLLVSSIKQILLEGQNESDIVNKIKSLVGVSSTVTESSQLQNKENTIQNGTAAAIPQSTKEPSQIEQEQV